MTESDARVTINKATSLDGYIAREHGRVDWMERKDEFKHGEELDSKDVSTFLSRISM